jgi:hypothetical protein
MNCQEFWNTMPEFEGAGDYSHLAGCVACQVRLERQRELAAGLRLLSEGSCKIAAPPRVEERLLAAFRTQSGTHPIHRRRLWVPVATWAAAIAAMLAIGFFLVRSHVPEAARSTATRTVERASVEIPAEFEGFIPLPNTEAVAAGEDMDVVHVEVPRSAMLAVGLDVDAGQAQDMVEADVMLGSDGVARAVRFLN